MKVVIPAGSQSGQMLQQALREVQTPKVLWWGLTPPTPNPNNIVCGPVLDGSSQLARMSEARVATPLHTTDINVARQWQATCNVWGRNNIHTQGRDIRQSTHREWPTKDFWVKQIPAAAILGEWRLHVFNGRSIARGKKTQTEIIARRLAPMVRSRRNGWRLNHTDAPPQGAKFYAKLATQSLGYLWGAVDMLEVDLQYLPVDMVSNFDRLATSHQKSGLNPFVVLEVNQRPGMDDYTCQQYATAIANYALANP